MPCRVRRSKGFFGFTDRLLRERFLLLGGHVCHNFSPFGYVLVVHDFRGASGIVAPVKFAILSFCPRCIHKWSAVKNGAAKNGIGKMGKNSGICVLVRPRNRARQAQYERPKATQPQVAVRARDTEDQSAGT